MSAEPRPFVACERPRIRGEVAGEGTPIVLSHGITATRRYVVHGSRALERAGYAVTSYDARGHGESDPAPAGQGYGYSELVDDSAMRERMFGMISEEFERTRNAVLRVTSQSELLQTNPTLARSIRLRNPYVDPMSLIQVELLRRKRSGIDSPELRDALASTMHGISAGLRNTG